MHFETEVKLLRQVLNVVYVLVEEDFTRMLVVDLVLHSLHVKEVPVNYIVRVEDQQENH